MYTSLHRELMRLQGASSTTGDVHAFSATHLHKVCTGHACRKNGRHLRDGASISTVSICGFGPWSIEERGFIQRVTAPDQAMTLRTSRELGDSAVESTMKRTASSS